MKDIGPIFRALTRNKLGAILIALQIAVTLAIVINAAYIIRERMHDFSRPTGVDEANSAVLTATLFDPGVDQFQLYQEDLRALRALPGVVAVTTTNAVPASGSGWGDDLYTRPDMPSNEAISYGRFMIDEQGLAAYGLELVAGRNFRADEILEVSEQKLEFPNVMIISQALADELFPDGNALGQTIWDEPNGQKPRQIIGIYGHMQNAWPHSEHVNRTGFEPVRLGLGGRMMYMLRTEPGQRDPVMRAAEDYLSKNRNRIIESVRSFDEVKRRTYSRDIAMVKLLSAVITVLVAVTGLGIVGLAWFSVTQRRRQIGTRRALGATRMDIVRYFMIENWLITTAGLAVGVVATLALNWLLDTQYEVGRVPLWFLPVGVVVLWILGQLAVLLPARRAAAIPPALATRSV